MPETAIRPWVTRHPPPFSSLRTFGLELTSESPRLKYSHEGSAYSIGSNSDSGDLFCHCFAEVTTYGET